MVDFDRNQCSDTVDGSEIRRSAVELGSLSHYLRRGLAPSQVVQDFFHQHINSIMKI